MESADTASTEPVLVVGLVKVDNILGALSVVYPTEENTAVYGPLALMDYKNWNDWVEFVGKYKGYGSDLAEHGTVNNQTELDAIIGKYAYGYNVVAGRVNYRDEIKLAMAEQPVAMLDRCRLEPLQMDRLIRRRQSKESDVPEVLQEK